MGLATFFTSVLLAGVAALISLVLRGKLGSKLKTLDFRQSDFGESVGLIFTVLFISAISSALITAIIFSIFLLFTSLLGYSEWVKESIGIGVIASVYAFTFLFYFILGIKGYFKKR